LAIRADKPLFGGADFAPSGDGFVHPALQVGVVAFREEIKAKRVVSVLLNIRQSAGLTRSQRPSRPISAMPGTEWSNILRNRPSLSRNCSSTTTRSVMSSTDTTALLGGLVAKLPSAF
jgi:hypothetical protein